MMWHETTHVCATVTPQGAPTAGSWVALCRGVYPAAVPDSAGQGARATPRTGGPAVELGDPERAQRHPGLSHPGASLFAGPIPAAQAHPPGARRRTVTGTAARAAPRFWETSPHLDPRLSCGGLLGTRPAPLPGEHRNHSPSPQPVGQQLATRHALEHQPRSAVGVQKTPRNRLICLAARHTEWVLGFADE